jgi:hypothetical protein
VEQITLRLAENIQGIGSAGERVTLALLPSDVHDATEIPTYLAGYKPFQYRADEASKIILVDNDEDKYRTFNSDDAFRRVSVKGSDQGDVPEVDPKSALVAYKVVNRYVGSFIPKQTQSQRGNNYDPVMAASRRCRRALDLDRELDVWALLGATGSWDSTVRTALGATYKWNGGASSNPIYDVQTAIEKSWQPVSAVWFNQKVANTFLRHSEVRNHMRQMLGDNAVDRAVASVAMAGERSVDFVIPGFPPFKVVASKVKNETTSALDYVLGDSYAVLVTVPPGTPTDGEEIASTYTFRRRGPSGTGFEAREFELATRGPLGGTMIVVSQADVAVMTGNKCGGIISGCIQ